MTTGEPSRAWARGRADARGRAAETGPRGPETLNFVADLLAKLGESR